MAVNRPMNNRSDGQENRTSAFDNRPLVLQWSTTWGHWSWACGTHYPVYLTVSESTTGGLLQSANLRGDVANVYLID